MEVIVMSRMDIIKYSYRPHYEISSVISISTPMFNYDGTNLFKSPYNGMQSIHKIL